MIRPVARRRALVKRSRFGCRNCKRRHVKCPENWPQCTHCVMAGLTCGGADNPFSERRSDLASPKVHDMPSLMELLSANANDRQMFHHFANEIAPAFGFIQEGPFWSKAVCPVAFNQPAVLNACLAMSTLFDLPKDEASIRMTRREYSKAITWYASSVRNLLELGSLPNTNVLLLISVVYIHAEMRQGNLLTAERLIRTSFSMIESAKDQLMISKDSVVLASILVLLFMPVAIVKSQIVLQKHRITAVAVALRICADLCVPKSQSLRFELLNIVYDVYDVLDGNPPAYGSIGERLANFYTDWKECGNLDGMFKSVFLMTSAQWQFSTGQDRGILEVSLIQARRLVQESISTAFSAQMPCPWLLDSVVIPWAIMIAWYWRSEKNQVMELLDPFVGDLAQLAKEYVQILLTSEYENATELEMMLYGKKPEFLRWWQGHECAQYMVHQAYQTALQRQAE